MTIRPWFLHWGATDAEWVQHLPGDELIPSPLAQCTRAITINAPPERIWPWIAQIGQGRGGFYSDTWLENLAGCETVNADRVHPEWQGIKTGDEVRLHPTAPRVPVAVVEPNHALVLGSSVLTAGAGFPAVDWAFVVVPFGPRRTRLLCRWRCTFPPTVGQYLANKYLLEPIHFIMERRMMLNIKALAERQSSSGSNVAATVSR